MLDAVKHLGKAIDLQSRTCLQSRTWTTLVSGTWSKLEINEIPIESESFEKLKDIISSIPAHHLQKESIDRLDDIFNSMVAEAL